MGLFSALFGGRREDWCPDCKKPMETARRQLYAMPGVHVSHYVEHKDAEFYKKNLYIVSKKADIPPGMYACGAIQYRCMECGRRVTVLDPFLPVRGEEAHEGNLVFDGGELDDFLWR